MPTLEHLKAIELYYQEVKDKYPDLTYEEFENICRSPFKFIKYSMRDGGLPIIPVKFLGKFRVFPEKVIKLMKQTRRYWEKGWIDDVEFENRSIFLEKYMDDIMKEQNDDHNFLIDDE